MSRGWAILFATSVAVTSRLSGVDDLRIISLSRVLRCPEVPFRCLAHRSGDSEHLGVVGELHVWSSPRVDCLAFAEVGFRDFLRV